MGFQKCPVCNGTTIKPGTVAQDCKTCAASGMINEFTGLPGPLVDNGKKSNINIHKESSKGYDCISDDFRDRPMESQ